MVFWHVALLFAVAQLTGAPRTATFEDDSYFLFPPGAPVVITEEEAPVLRPVIERLGAAAGQRLRVVSAAEEPPDPAIYIGTVGRHPLLEQRRLRRWVNNLGEPGPEGYRLIVRSRFIIVAGRDIEGTLHGARRLVSLVLPDGRVPVGRLRDEPHARLRGVVLDAIPGTDQLDGWVEARANLLAVSRDALAADSAALDTWNAFVDAARTARIIPALHVDLDAPAQRADAASDPRVAKPVRQVDHVSLPSDDWQLLTCRNIVDAPEGVIRARAGGNVFQRDRDFVILPGSTEPPYADDAAPWMIRRVPGGAIPDGGQVEVIYDYMPPLDPNAAAIAALRSADPLAETGILERLCVDFVVIEGASDGLDRVSRLLVTWPGTVILAAKSRDAAVADWPAEFRARTIVAVPANDPAVQSLAMTAKTLGARVVIADTGDSGSVYEAARLAGVAEGSYGVLIRGDEPEPARRALQRAWAPEAESLPWPEGLNAVFEADLWEPDYAEVQSALVRHTNRRTLAGVTPDAALADIRGKLEPLRRTLRHEAVDQAGAIYEQLVGWLQLESAYDRTPSREVLQDLIRLVDRQAKLDPRFEADRLQRITEIVQTKGLFVPSSILFREFVLPYRPIRTPAGARLLRAPGQIDYADAEHEAVATVDFLAAPGPITRIDFDTVGTARCTVEHSTDGKQFVLAEERTSTDAGGLRGPMLLREPVMSRYLRVTVEAPAELAVLRELRVSALKHAARVACPRVSQRPALDADFKEPFWPVEAPIVGFVSVESDTFASPQSTVRVVAGPDSLCVAAYLRESRMETKVVSGRMGDSDVTEDESFEIRLALLDGPVYRFVVTADGSRLDARAGDVAWDTHWDSYVKDYPGGWAVETALPFEALGRSPQSGDVWRADFVRYRRNVTDEVSSWTGEAPSEAPNGILEFR